MNKITKIITLVAVMLSATVLTASAKIPFLMYGASAGVNMSNLYISSEMDEQLKQRNDFGYQGGLMIGLDLPLLEVTAEALWVHNTMSASINQQSADIVCNTIECPIMASLPILGPVRLKAGPSFNIPINAKATYADGFEDLGALKSTVGYAVGVGLNLFNVTFDIRYNGQFSNKKTVLGVQSVGSEYDIMANSFSASIGYRF